MTVSMRVMSAGAGCAYLLKSVAAGDGDRSLATSLTRYYVEKGTPPGRWLGNGVSELADGVLAAGDRVSEEQLKLLLGEGRDPVTGEALGFAYPQYRTREERVRERVNQLDAGLDSQEHAHAVVQVEAEEAARPQRRAVAGYDFTFSVPKSVSTLWAVAGARTQAEIVRAHHAAIDEVLALVQRDVAATRCGLAGSDGAVAQVDVTGVVATAFDHFDSRAGDPQLHTHVVISSKARTAHDGVWRSLDGRPMHAAVVALSEQYNALLADHLTRKLGVRWEQRSPGADRNPGWEIAGVPDELVRVFSSRTAQIDAETDRLIAAFVATHGRRPSPRAVIKLRAQATVATRPEKTVRSLAELTAQWRERATAAIGEEADAWVQRVIAPGTPAELVHAAAIAPEDVEQLARIVVHAVGERRATWTRWNVHAEAARQLMRARFVSAADRETVTRLVVEAAERASIQLSPPELAPTPESFTRGDGTSVFRPKHSTVFTSPDVLAAEARLLERSRSTDAPSIDPVLVAARVNTAQRGVRLADDQAAAISRIASSRRSIDVLLGPAGTGKTTTMNALRQVWEATYGPGSVVGLAPSAASAEVLATDLGIDCENTAKWLHDHHVGRARLHAGQLVILDEASLAGTATLGEITAHAAATGAKVLMVGDWAQLGAIDAGGAFGLLVRDRDDDIAELVEVHRFRHAWERGVSLRLRRGDTTSIAVYARHGRLIDGCLDDVLDAAYTAWRQDIAAGKSSLMIAQTRETTADLNSRARHDRILAGQVEPVDEVNLRDGTRASVGDVVMTRRNDRQLRAGRGWVKNGDRWVITASHDDGSLTVQRGNHRARVVLPAEYVAEHVELAYAVTVHRAQGATVDTAHAVVASPSTTRETLYVAMTRGRESNTAYVATDQAHLEEHQKHPDDEITASSVLRGILRRVGTEMSAHEALRAEQERWSSITQLAAEYDTIAAAAQRDRWTAVFYRSGLTAEQAHAVTTSPALGALMAALRRSEAHGYDVEALLARAVGQHRLDDADDIAAVLHKRITNTRTHPGRQRPKARLIAGIIPEAVGPMTPEFRSALDERRHLIEQRARHLAQLAVRDRAPWTRHLGTPPADPESRRVWFAHVETVAAYRDRYDITGDEPLGSPPETATQRIDAGSARVALRTARHLAQVPHPQLHTSPHRETPVVSM